MKKKIKHPQLKCPYCGRHAILREASFVYQDRAIEKYLYVCSGYPECDSYVGVHAGTLNPKGTLADGDLRHKRILAHHMFDKIWKSQIMSKKDAYCWIQDIFSLSRTQAHIGEFSDYRCDCLIKECEKVLRNNEGKLPVNFRQRKAG